MKSSDFDSLHNVVPGRHFYQFYKGFDDYMKVLIPFFRNGILKDEYCLWVVSANIGVDSATRWARATLPDFDGAVGSGQFTLMSAEEWYLRDDHFDEKKALENVERFYDNAVKQGYQVLRASGDMAAIPPQELPQFFEYEKKVMPWVASHQAIALCTYPITECSLADTKNVIDTHDEFLVANID